MNQKKISIILAMTLVVGTTIWFGLQHQPATTQALPAPKILPEQLPSFSMQDTAGNTRNSGEWRGKILIVNFWASWCPPCLEEMPDLIKLQEQYSSQGVQVIGVAIDDQEQAKKFMRDQGINFPVIIGVDDAMELGKKMGNRISTLPYTAIFDQQGKTRYAQPGKISKNDLERLVKTLL